MTLSASAPSPAAPPTPVFALLRSERALFFPAGLDARAFPEAVWLDDADLEPDAWRVALERTKPRVLVTGWRTPALPEAWLEQPECPLRYVCHVTGAVRRLVPRSFIAGGGQVSNWAGLAAPQVAEHALLLALCALRNQSRWQDFIAHPPGDRSSIALATRTLFGRRVGIHGFGAVARALIPLLRPFGVRISVHAAVAPPMIHAQGAHPVATLEALCAESDVFFECEALTSRTKGSVSGAQLARLPTDAVFVNIARGGLIDEPALVREAASGRLRVAVDVIADEPVRPESALFRTPGVVVSPHMAGPTLDRYADCGDLALQNLARFARGETPLGLVTLDVYDRST